MPMREAIVQEVETRLREMFEESFEFIRAEGGHSITEFIKEEAFRQVLFYFRKNVDLIAKIAQAEVKLTLPEQVTPNDEIRYTIEGVIDIVREGDETWMYDVKTHDRFAVESNKELYRQQLNVYAYIWTKLMGNDLDNTAVISTSLPVGLKNAIKNGNAEHVRHEMEQWEPVIPLGYSEEEIESMIQQFGSTVEEIEHHEFAAPPIERLYEKDEGGRGNLREPYLSQLRRAVFLPVLPRVRASYRPNEQGIPEVLRRLWDRLHDGGLRGGQSPRR